VGIFSKLKQFRETRADARNEKNLRTLKNPKAIKEDRSAAIEYFKSEEDPTLAVPALLQRFEYSLEHGINDAREKEACLEGVVRHGEAAVPRIQEHLQQTSRIAWPIKCLKSLGREELVTNCLKSALNFGDVAFDQAQTDKNYDILCYLVDYQLPGFTQELAHFLKDPDERVRFAATEVLIEQKDPQIPTLLEPFLADVSVENTRIRQSVMRAFLERKWKVEHPEVFPTGQVVDNIFISKQGSLELRR
jgi:hypothetical protein